MSTKDNGSNVPVFWDRLRRQPSFSRPVDAFAEDKGRGAVITMCVLVSALLWFTFSMRETHSLALQLSTEIQNLPDGEALVGLAPKNVQFEVEGEGLSLIRLYYNPPVIVVDAASDEVDFVATAPELPKSIRIENATPRMFYPRREASVTKKVPIRPRLTITTPNTHDLTTPPTIQPDSVVVTGARSIIDSVAEWPTVSFESSSLEDTLDVSLALRDSLNGLVNRDVEEVRLLAVSQEFTGATREIDVIITGAPSQKFVTLDPSSVTVRFRVLLSQFNDAARATDFFATVSHDDIRTDTTGRIRPVIHLPSGIVLTDVQHSPPTLRYYDYLVDE